MLIKGLQKTGLGLYMFALHIFAFGWESLSPADVLHPASLPAHILEKQITATFPSFQLHHSQYLHWKTGGPQPCPEALSVSFVAWSQ